MLRVRSARPFEREQIIALIDHVAGECSFMQTNCFLPTPKWESLLRECIHPEKGHLLLVLQHDRRIAGFARLFPDEKFGRKVGNVGLALLPEYRSRKLGTWLLGLLLSAAPHLKYQALTADILADNERSIRLFTRFQFQVTSQQKIRVPYRSTEVAEVTVKRSISVGEEVNCGLSNHRS